MTNRKRVDPITSAPSQMSTMDIPDAMHIESIASFACPEIIPTLVLGLKIELGPLSSLRDDGLLASEGTQWAEFYF